MHFRKKHREALQAHHGEAYLTKALCDLHVNKGNAHVVSVLIGKDAEVNERTLKIIWDSLLSYGRQLFTLTVESVKQLAWAAVASLKSAPVFLMTLKRAAESMINASGAALKKATSTVVASAKLFWEYVSQLFTISPVNATEKQRRALEVTGEEVRSISDIIDTFGEQAVRALNWIAKGVVRLVDALFKLVADAAVLLFVDL